MVNKNVLSCLLKDGKEVNAVMLVGRLFHARATVTRNHRSPSVRTRCVVLFTYIKSRVLETLYTIGCRINAVTNALTRLRINHEKYLR